MKPIDLKEHPEGGRFREVFRSAKTVSTQDGITKSALTHIYFSLKPDEVSRFHKVASDEIWNLYQGQVSTYTPGMVQTHHTAHLCSPRDGQIHHSLTNKDRLCNVYESNGFRYTQTTAHARVRN